MAEELAETIVAQRLGSEQELDTFFARELGKHRAKVHFIPIKYRVLGGFLQSLNIRFGNFLELLVAGVLADLGFEVVEEGTRKKLPLELETQCEALIDQHTNVRPDLNQLPTRVESLFQGIFDLQNRPEGRFIGRTLDVNLLCKKEDIHYYIEVKYNDDHDTGKYMDINRKFLKTYAGLVRKFGFRGIDGFKPVLYYFNPYRRYYPSYYLRDGVEVFRGSELFDEFGFPGTYDRIRKILEERVSEQRFDQLRQWVFGKVGEALGGGP